MEQFKAGDVVQLKSGGPKMTVETYDRLAGKYECVWFEGHKRHVALFSEESLKVAETDFAFEAVEMQPSPRTTGL